MDKDYWFPKTTAVLTIGALVLFWAVFCDFMTETKIAMRRQQLTAQEQAARIGALEQELESTRRQQNHYMEMTVRQFHVLTNKVCEK